MNNNFKFGEAYKKAYNALFEMRELQKELQLENYDYYLKDLQAKIDFCLNKSN
jgi:hypothetical protein